MKQALRLYKTFCPRGDSVISINIIVYRLRGVNVLLNNLLGVILSFLYFFVIIFIPKLFPKTRNEFARKFVHIMIGNWWLILLAFISNTLCALLVPATFIFINYFSVTQSHDTGLLASLERKEGEAASSFGLVLYPISLVIMVIFSFVFSNKHYLGGVGIIALSYGDGFAALIGKKWPFGTYRIGHTKKTVVGSIAMFLITSIILAAYLSLVVGYSSSNIIWVSILTAAIATLVEAATPNGFDNLSIPIVAVLVFEICSCFNHL